ncbi:MAG TPA: amidohydrolase family protein [Acidimicrobiia bacterium]|nr:amidohydrolase family protein [Acidimicrobiia bacterium]
MTPPVVVAGTLVGAPEHPTGRGWVELRDAQIAAIGSGPAPTPPEDLGDVVVVPGFVDLQVNGVGHHDFASAGVDDWLAALGFLARRGTTACLPTLVSAPLDSYDAILEIARAARDLASRDDAHAVAQVLGLHLEGPFLGGAPGAHVREHVRAVDLEWLEGLLDRHGDLIRMVTLAPEADPHYAATRLLAAHGIVVALGHSTASYDDAIAAAAAGARVVTHVFNGMAALHHRAPGLAGAALTVAGLTPTVIADLVHVHPAVVDLVVRARPDGVLVSDAVAATGGAAGPVALRDAGDAARLADGTLAGSTITMADAVRNTVETGAPLDVAVAMASARPASLLGDRERGRLEVGARADVVALDAETLEPLATWVGGRRAHAD